MLNEKFPNVYRDSDLYDYMDFPHIKREKGNIVFRGNFWEVCIPVGLGNHEIGIYTKKILPP
ncbi:MAG: hypothetical protein CM1200mP3_18560 [Chloroflexota bacterium]|nr:MAG: hypothetical protein CM1200mP3_18560 [Chloroflexota bacterium]